MRLISEWDSQPHRGGHQIRLVFGAAPFTTVKHTFRSDRTEFSEDVRNYLIEDRGISLRSSAQVLQTIEAIKRGSATSRFIHVSQRLHAKVYVGDAAATIGSSNFTLFGLGLLHEANARFYATTEPDRYRCSKSCSAKAPRRSRRPFFWA